MENGKVPPKREKFLNVVYFIDGSRTYNLKLSVKILTIIGSVCAVILVWSIASIFFLTKSKSEMSDLRSEYKKSLAKILDFQISNEKVYEQAYPQAKTEKVITEAPVKEQQKESPKEQSKDLPKDAALKEPTKTESAKAKTEEKKEEKKAEAINGLSDSLRITASNPRFKHEAGTISFAFDLKNENTKGQSEGFVWVVAEIALASGATTKVAAPASVALDGSGEIKNHKQAYRFSIKRFRDREFKLKEPKDAIELKKATVFVTDAKRTRIDRFEFTAGLTLKEPVKSGALKTHHKRQLANRR